VPAFPAESNPAEETTPMALIPRITAAILLALAVAGCESEPAPIDPIERPWQAAIGAIEDAGLKLVTADRATGTVRGTRGSVEGTILVRMRSDGRVGVEFTARDPENRDPGVTRRMADAYNRRMGR
jgi:hypothetical protein